MTKLQPILVGKSEKPVYLYPQMANRHGLIAGATGTGKTITLKVLAESFSRMGVPVFLADIKGDLGSTAIPGIMNPKIQQRVTSMELTNFDFQEFPTRFWDVFGEHGHPVRTTISEMGPLLISRLLNLNDTQTGVINIVFKIADDTGLLLIDLKDLRAMLKYVGDNSQDYTTDYGNMSKQSIGAIQRGLLTLEEQGADQFFGEPALDIVDLMKVDENEQGFINVLSATKLFQSPALYSTFLLWLLSELFEELPEIGDVDKPKIVFFFDEAHLLFDDAPKALLDQIEQVVRLIRSKGVGIYFVTQNPIDIPDKVLGQLGNRIQHALRAFTPRDQKAVNSAAETFRANPAFEVKDAITDLKVGEALISCLDEEGRPSMVERALVLPPRSLIGIVTNEKRQELIQQSEMKDKYQDRVDKESAYELLKIKAEKVEIPLEKETYDYGKTKSKVRPKKSEFQKVAQSLINTVGRQVGRELIRGIFGALKRK